MDKEIKNIKIKEAAKLMGKSEKFVRIGLQGGLLPFWVAEKTSTKYNYYILPKEFYNYIGE